MKVLGLDPGIARLGYGVITVRRGSDVSSEHGCISTPTTDTQAERLAYIRGEIVSLIQKVKPDVIAVEKLFFQKNVKTALTVGEARGVVMLCVGEAGIALREFTPLVIKQAVTGYGRADKGQVQRMLKILLKLDAIPKPDDAADALAVAYTAWLSMGSRI